ncbi:MAG: ABC transporter ATP-binding protein [Patescibacteria group bacterium]
MPKNKNKEKFYAGLKIVIRQLAVYKNELIILSFLGVVSAVANAVVPFLAGRLFDAILRPSKIFIGAFFEMPLWLFFIILWAVVRFITDAVDWIISKKGVQLEEYTHSDYVVNGFNILLELPLSFHKDKKLGEITDRIDRAANWISRIANDVIVGLSPQILSVFVVLIIAFFINYLLTLVLLVAIVIYVAILIKIAPPLALLQRKANKTYNKAYGSAYDSIFNVIQVKQAVAEKYEKRKVFKNFRLKAARLWTEMMHVWQGLNLYQRLIITSTQLVIFVISFYFIQAGKMTIGELVMFNGYASMLFGPFIRLGNNYNVVQNGLIAIERADRILASPKEVYIPENAVVLPAVKGEVEFKNVSFAYSSSRRGADKKSKPVLEDINFKVKAGEVIALVGESGMGKSTLVDLISAYYFPLEGKVLIDGHDTRNFDLKFLRSQIAVVPQEVVLFNDTIELNIKYGSFGASLNRVKEAARKADALEFIEKFPKKWKQIVGERGIKLSVGQKQRVAIARAILRNPKILILDEPTSALDAKAEKAIAESLEELMKGKTTFIIAHRLSTVRKADRIFVLENGKIAEEGRHEELIKKPNGIYRELYNLQIGLKD